MSIAALLEQAGVVGCGGAGFPTYAKLANSSSIDFFIVNGAECEPLLRTDRYVMRNFAEQVIFACSQIAREMGAGHCIVALKAGYREEIAALEQAIKAANASVSLHLMASFYPAGDEQTMVYEVTGRVVPAGGIPLDVGCVVANAASMLAAADAIHGKPFTHKYLTISGEVRNPTIVYAPLGTPLSECLALAGGAALDDYRVLLGGPMMGRMITRGEMEAEMVTKTLSGLVILPQSGRLQNTQQLTERQIVTRARAACIRCSQCSELCPRRLLGHPLEPHRIMRSLALCGSIADLPLDEPIIQSAALCCECGVCELISCPMELQPRRINAMLRKRFFDAGFRYPKGEGQIEVHPLREARQVPTVRAAARAGVYRYQQIAIDRLAEARPQQVILPLSQHIGVPCAALLPSGEQVTTGQLIAASPPDKLGSKLHASISGILHLENDRLIIRAEGGAHK